MLIEVSAAYYGSYFGGQNTYQIYSTDIRKFFRIKKDGRTLALQLKGRVGFGDVPYGEMSQPGTPFDLRGYIWGNTGMNPWLFFIGIQTPVLQKKWKLSAHGLVGWVGVGSLGDKVRNFEDWLPCVESATGYKCNHV